MPLASSAALLRRSTREGLGLERSERADPGELPAERIDEATENDTGPVLSAAAVGVSGGDDAEANEVALGTTVVGAPCGLCHGGICAPLKCMLEVALSSTLGGAALRAALAGRREPGKRETHFRTPATYGGASTSLSPRRGLVAEASRG